jgi:hypothetical protein
VIKISRINCMSADRKKALTEFLSSRLDLMTFVFI